MNENHSNVSPESMIYLVGMVATAFMLLMIPVQIGAYLIWPHPSTISEWFVLFQESWVIGLISFDFLYLLSMVASIFLYLALFYALRDRARSLSGFALVVGLIGLAVYFPSNTSIEMLVTSQQYALAASQAEKAALLASGYVFHATWKGTAYAVYYVLNGASLILFFSAMIKSDRFRRSTAYFGLVAGVLMTVPATAGTVGMAMALGSLVPWSLFSALVIVDFRRLAARSR